MQDLAKPVLAYAKRLELDNTIPTNKIASLTKQEFKDHCCADTVSNILKNNPQINAPTPMSKDEEMELFGIQNNCIRVIEDYVNGGYMCDDFE